MFRITNFVAVSDTPFAFDRARWQTLLETMRIEERPVLDLTDLVDRRVYEDLLGFNDIEPRDSIVTRYAATQRVVTDDNMVTEWREPLRYPRIARPSP
jgi:hypothetical protein